MKHLKTLGAALIVAAAFTALFGAASASATVICSTTADPCPVGQSWPNGTKIDWSIPSGGSIVQRDTSGNTLDSCTTSTMEWEITNRGGATSTVTGKFSEPVSTTGTTWSGCTITTKTLTTSAKWEIHKIAGTSDSTVTSDSAIEWTTNTVLFGSCIYGFAANVDVGTITEGIGSGAKFNVNAVVTRFGTNVACPATTKMTGTYILTTPGSTTLSISESGS